MSPKPLVEALRVLSLEGVDVFIEFDDVLASLFLHVLGSSDRLLELLVLPLEQSTVGVSILRLLRSMGEKGFYNEVHELAGKSRFTGLRSVRRSKVHNL